MTYTLHGPGHQVLTTPTLPLELREYVVLVQHLNISYGIRPVAYANWAIKHQPIPLAILCPTILVVLPAKSIGANCSQAKNNTEIGHYNLCLLKI